MQYFTPLSYYLGIIIKHSEKKTYNSKHWKEGNLHSEHGKLNAFSSQCLLQEPEGLSADEEEILSIC